MSRKTKYIFKCCIVLQLAFTLACVEENPIVELNKRNLETVDSMYSAQKPELLKYTDSLCDLRYQVYYANAVDSIKKIRLEEIEFILGK